MRTFFLLFFSTPLWVNSTLAQGDTALNSIEYKYLLENTTPWDQESYWTYYHLSQDTVIDTLPYNIVEYFAPYSHTPGLPGPSFYFYMREDTLGRVFARFDSANWNSTGTPSDTDILVYDYGANQGDTLWIHDGAGSTEPYVIDTAYSAFVFGSNRRVLSTHRFQIGTSDIWVEGIGSLTNLAYPWTFLNPSEWINLLLCYSDTISGTVWEPFIDQDSILGCDYPVSITELNQVPPPVIYYADNHLVVKDYCIKHALADSHIQVLDISGRVILEDETPECTGEHLTIPVGELKKGIYILRINNLTPVKFFAI